MDYNEIRDVGVMMKIELDNMIIEYNNCDLDYIEFLVESLNKRSMEILHFFGFEKLEPKVRIRLWPNLEKYRNVFKLENQNIVGIRQKVNQIPTIEMLSLKEVKKIKYYENATINDFENLVLHEFVHECQSRYTTKKSYIWLWEGMATYLSKQYGETYFFSSTLEDNYQENILII